MAKTLVGRIGRFQRLFCRNHDLQGAIFKEILHLSAMQPGYARFPDIAQFLQGCLPSEYHGLINPRVFFGCLWHWGEILRWHLPDMITSPEFGVSLTSRGVERMLSRHGKPALARIDVTINSREPRDKVARLLVSEQGYRSHLLRFVLEVGNESITGDASLEQLKSKLETFPFWGASAPTIAQTEAIFQHLGGALGWRFSILRSENPKLVSLSPLGLAELVGPRTARGVLVDTCDCHTFFAEHEKNLREFLGIIATLEATFGGPAPISAIHGACTARYPVTFGPEASALISGLAKDGLIRRHRVDLSYARGENTKGNTRLRVLALALTAEGRRLIEKVGL